MLALLLVASAAHADPARQTVRRVVKRDLMKILACYELHGVPHAPRVVLRFTIGRTGRVLAATASGATGKPVQDCIVGVFKRMTFPPAPMAGSRANDVIKVTYPIQICTAGS